MPPWLPEPGEFPIVGERRLRDDQIDLIQRWVKGGKVEGNPADLPKAPVVARRAGSSARPDVVLTPERPYTLRPGTEDVYRNLVLHTSLKADVVRARRRVQDERRADSPRRHSRRSQRRRRVAATAQDGQPGFDGMSWQDSPGSRRPVHRLGARPRADRLAGRHAVAARARRRSRRRAARARRRTCRARFSRRSRCSSPTRRRRQTPLTRQDGIEGSSTFRPGSATTSSRTRTSCRCRVDLLSVYPHAHYLGEEMLVIGDAAGRRREDAAAHQAVELPLAAGLSLRHADRAAARHDADDAVHVRQLGAERGEPASSAGAGAVGPAIDRRDGRARAAGAAEVAGGCRAARASRSTIATRWPMSRWGRCACARRPTTPKIRRSSAAAYVEVGPVRRRDSAS